MVRRRTKVVYKQLPRANFDPEIDTHTDDYWDYEKDSWDLWERTLVAHSNGMLRDDLDSYLPNPREIDIRKQQVQWMYSFGFTSRFICAVMQHDCFSFDLIVRMAKNRDANEIEVYFKSDMPSTEYDYDDF